MSDTLRLRPLLQTLLDVHRAAFELREHEVAFHALSGAAHAAESIEDLEALRAVEALARDQLAWLDAHAPEHRHSSHAAKARGHHSIFAQLGVTAAGMRTRIEADRRIKEAREGKR